MVNGLKKEGINIVERRNSDGILYGLTYVDHQTKCVFNGSDLGKQYSAKGIIERCQKSHELRQDKKSSKQQDATHPEHNNGDLNKQQNFLAELPTISNIGKILDDLLQPIQGNNYLPHQLKKTKKKKQKNTSNNL